MLKFWVILFTLIVLLWGHFREIQQKGIFFLQLSTV